jgi:hypothetical protein
MTNKAQTVKDLRAMASLVKSNGLVKGRFVLVGGDKPLTACPVCSLGAIGVVVWGDPYGPADEAEADLTPEEVHEREWRFIAARQALAAAVGTAEHSVPEWNDADERTQEEVVSAFRAAADALEAAE